MARRLVGKHKYRDFTRALLSLGFEYEPDSAFMRLVHEPTGTVIMLRKGEPDEIVWEPNVISARFHIDFNGIATAEEFDRLLANPTLAKAS